MVRISFGAYEGRIFTEYLFCFMFACIAAAIPANAAASLTVQQPNFSPTTVTVGGNFSFGFNINSTAVTSGAIVVMDVKDSAGNMLLQKYFSGQSFAAGKTTPYSWISTIPKITLSKPFAAGSSYNVVVYVANSNWTAYDMAPVTVTRFNVVAAGAPAAAASVIAPSIASVPVYNPPTPNVGYTATAPIQPPAATGKIYYVSDPGNAANDKSNRVLLPAGAAVYPTIQAAADLTQPGDQVLVMNGTYAANPTQWVDGVLTINRSGSATGGYITYSAYPGHHPVIQMAGDTNAWDAIAIEASYIVVRGFEVVGNAQYVTLAHASQATATAEAALQIEASAHLGASLPSVPDKRLTNSNCIAGTAQTHVMILNNLVHDCSGGGIDMERSDYTNVEANTVYNTSWWTMYDTSGISLHLSMNSDSSTTYKNFVLDNVAYDSANTQPFVTNIYNNDVKAGSAPAAPTDGNGIIIDTNQGTNDGSPYLGRTLVAGNIAYGNGGSGIHAYLSGHVDIINNTAYMNDTCPVAGSTCGPAASTFNGAPISGLNNGQIYAMSSSDVNIDNNILYAPAGKMLYTSWNNTKVAENNNIMYSANGQIVLQGYTPTASDFLADPVFANKSTPEKNNFLFAAASPGINSGVSFTSNNISTPTLLGLTVVNGKVSIGADQ